jgi:hypothetical protein
MRSRNLAVGSIALISGMSAAAAGLVAAVSLTRIAREKLGFPGGLEWTLTAAVDIGAIGGAILWSISRPRSSNRRTGMRLNIACSTVSAIGVGLDHYSNAHPDVPWGTVAFLVGAFMPLLSTWLVHGLAKLSHGDVVAAPDLVAAPVQSAPVAATAEVVASPVPQAAPAPPAPRKAVTARQSQRPAPRPPAVVLTKPEQPGLKSVPRAAADIDPREWAIANMPTTAKAIEEATGCSRSTSFRALKAARAEVGDRNGAVVA